MKKFFFIAVVLTFSSFCFADTTITQKIEGSAIMGQPAMNTTQTIKIKGTKARIDLGNQHKYQILDLSTKKMFLVDPDKKEAMSMSVDMLNAAGAMFKNANQNAEVNVQNTGNSRTVNGFKCTDYVITLSGPMSMTSKQCVTKDIDYKDFEAFRPYAEGMIRTFMGDKGMAKLPQGMAASAETTISLMGQNHTSKTELQSIKKEDLPASVFEVPADFKLMEAPMGMPKQQ
jgi:hypothetical protein